MATKKKALQAAAGWAASQGGAVTPEGVSFDGTNDYLSRSSDLSGNADGKTFTFSAWFYHTMDSGKDLILYRVGSGIFHITIKANNKVMIGAYNGGDIIDVRTTDYDVPKNTWNHLLISMDTSVGNTTKTHIYLNDVSLTGGLTSSTVVNSNIDFTQSTHNVHRYSDSTPSRGAHLYLDYTYRDLSNSSNRRLFITEDLKPADDQASLSPILYLPLTDADTAGNNSGTGGDFTVNGTLDTASRGPNQYNCVASTLDDDTTINNGYLTKSGTTGTATEITISFTTLLTSSQRIYTQANSSGQERLEIKVQQDKLEIIDFNSSNTQVVNITSTISPTAGSNTFHTISASLNFATSTYKVYVDGVACSVVENANAGSIQSYSDRLIGAHKYNGTIYTSGRNIGELYFDTDYIDLSTDNPFWDESANRPKPVRQVLDETGNTPLIAMPLIANNAGLNLGTGGDFTVNSGPYTGARGGSEYWARSIKGNGTTGYLSRASITGINNSKTLSIVFSYKRKSASMTSMLNLKNSSRALPALKVMCEDTGSFSIFSWNSSNTNLLNISSAFNVNPFTLNEHVLIFCSIDLSTSTAVVKTADGSDISLNTPVFVNQAMEFNGCDRNYVGAEDNGGTTTSYIDGDESFLYFTTDYIDFSQEANRNLFVDQLGYPKDLTQAIEDGDIPNPLIYLRFDDPDDLGANSGTGGDFTINGTVTPGEDVDPN